MADLDHSAKVGKLEVTPLLAAAHSGHLQAVRILLEGGLNVNERDGTHHNTALMLAAREGWLDVTLYLLDHGADVQSGNKYGNTALIMACEKSRKEVVQLLLERGASRDVKNHHGKSAFDWATPEIKRLLVSIAEQGNPDWINDPVFPETAAPPLPAPNAEPAPVQVQAQVQDSAVVDEVMPRSEAPIVGETDHQVPPPTEPAAAEESSETAERAESALEARFTVIVQQAAHVEQRAGLIQRQNLLDEQYAAALAAKQFGTVAELGLQRQALQKEAGPTLLSAEEFATLRDRHAALVVDITRRCEELAAEGKFPELGRLAACLSQLQALDLSTVERWLNKPVDKPVVLITQMETVDN